jgi:dTDP-4-dehydrorhamnose 3,5-epimerase
MKILKNKIKGSFTIIPNIVKDNRGFFARLMCSKVLKKHIKQFKIVQCNSSFSVKKGTIRGLHYQTKPFEEAKLIHCIAGSIYDVIIDLRKKSPTYLKWESFVLSKKNKRLLFIPRGCAHGFLTTADNTAVIYYVNNFYNPKYEKVIKYNDKKFNIKWPISIKRASKKDT